MRAELSFRAQVISEHSTHTSTDGHDDLGLLRAESPVAPGNKWIDAQSMCSSVEVKIDGPIHVSGFGFKAANENPEQDPHAVEVFADDQFVAAFELNFDNQRALHFLEDIDVNAKDFKFVFANPDGRNMQVSEVEFYTLASDPFDACPAGLVLDEAANLCVNPCMKPEEAPTEPSIWNESACAFEPLKRIELSQRATVDA